MDIKQINAIADKINESVNIPLIGEKVEKYFIVGAVVAVATILLEKGLELSDYIGSPDNIIPSDKWAEIVEQSADSINKLVDIPVMSESQEKFIIQMVLDYLGQLAKEKISLPA